jgi:2-C-methyl-D-erythritol 4-phosphate cytidylyltransferase
VLTDALRRAGADATDEASAIEAIGLAPRLVLGSVENLKVTHMADFALAEALLQARRQ